MLNFSGRVTIICHLDNKCLAQHVLSYQTCKMAPWHLITPIHYTNSVVIRSFSTLLRRRNDIITTLFVYWVLSLSNYIWKAIGLLGNVYSQTIPCMLIHFSTTWLVLVNYGMEKMYLMTLRPAKTPINLCIQALWSFRLCYLDEDSLEFGY